MSIAKKSFIERLESLTFASALTVINGIILWKSVDWFLNGIDRPWDAGAYALILLPVVGFLLGIFLIIHAFRRSPSWLTVFAGIIITIVDVILLVFV